MLESCEDVVAAFRGHAVVCGVGDDEVFDSLRLFFDYKFKYRFCKVNTFKLTPCHGSGDWDIPSLTFSVEDGLQVDMLVILDWVMQHGEGF